MILQPSEVSESQKKNYTLKYFDNYKQHKLVGGCKHNNNVNQMDPFILFLNRGTYFLN